jgi:hypothetical protein
MKGSNKIEHSHKCCQAVFKQMLPKQLDWKRQLPSLALGSPDLTPLGIFLWGYLKNIVCEEKITGLLTLQHCSVIEAIAAVTKVTLVNTWHEVKYIFYMCSATVVLTLKLTR